MCQTQPQLVSQPDMSNSTSQPDMAIMILFQTIYQCIRINTNVHCVHRWERFPKSAMIIFIGIKLESAEHAWLSCEESSPGQIFLGNHNWDSAHMATWQKSCKLNEYPFPNKYQWETCSTQVRVVVRFPSVFLGISLHFGGPFFPSQESLGSNALLYPAHHECDSLWPHNKPSSSKLFLKIAIFMSMENIRQLWC